MKSEKSWKAWVGMIEVSALAIRIVIPHPEIARQHPWLPISLDFTLADGWHQ